MQTGNQSGRVTRRVRTLVADDEPLARELMSNLVRRDAGLELMAAVGSGAEVLQAVERFAVELILLDIQMPNLDGVSVAEQLAQKVPAPYVIFVTAHDEFALQAFEVAVRDYLVKPVSKRRFAAALRRAKDVLGVTADPLPSQDALVVKSGDAVISIVPEDIVWVAAANQYVCLHTAGGAEFVVSQSLRQFGRGLPSGSFLRIHRSTLINLRYLAGVHHQRGRYRVRLADGTMHDVARSRRGLVPELLQAVRENPNR